MGLISDREYAYCLRLEVKDHGSRVYKSKYESDCQSGLGDSLVYDIKRMFGILNSPPLTENLVVAMEGECKEWLGAMAQICCLWDMENEISDAVKVTVDVSKLVTNSDPGIIALLRDYAEGHNIELVNIPHVEVPVEDEADP